MEDREDSPPDSGLRTRMKKAIEDSDNPSEASRKCAEIARDHLEDHLDQFGEILEGFTDEAK